MMSGMMGLTTIPGAVIPVFVTGGSALFPALMAGLAGALAFLFKPRLLWGAIRRRPYLAVLPVLGLAVAVWVRGAGDRSPRDRSRSPTTSTARYRTD